MKQTFKEKMEVFSQCNREWNEKCNIEKYIPYAGWSLLSDDNVLKIFNRDDIIFRLKPTEIYINAYSDGTYQVFETESKAIDYLEYADDKVLDYRFKGMECTEKEYRQLRENDAWRKNNGGDILLGLFETKYRGKGDGIDYSLEILLDNTKPKYRAFQDGNILHEMINSDKEIWVIFAKWHTQIKAYNDELGIRLKDSDGNMIELTWDSAFERIVFEDGTPFGIKL